MRKAIVLYWLVHHAKLLTDDSFLQAYRKDFKSNFNLHPFKFNHTLHRSGLFEIPRIIEISKRMIENNGDYSALDFRHGSIRREVR